MGGNMNDKQK
jgi:hypothetical protein